MQESTVFHLKHITSKFYRHYQPTATTTVMKMRKKFIALYFVLMIISNMFTSNAHYFQHVELLRRKEQLV